MKIICAMLIAILPLGSASAIAGGAKKSNAASWGLVGEEMARFEGKVVDILCELSGDCPKNCGGGTRQLGIVRTDGRLFLVNKNVEKVFTGAVVDLLPYCQKQVEVDGLLVGDAPAKLYQVQLIREVGEAEWTKTTRFTKTWAIENPQAAKAKGPWFRKDPRIIERIEAEGYLGLGKDADDAYIREETEE